jgi:hypothetical protein
MTLQCVAGDAAASLQSRTPVTDPGRLMQRLLRPLLLSLLSSSSLRAQPAQVMPLQFVREAAAAFPLAMVPAATRTTSRRMR